MSKWFKRVLTVLLVFLLVGGAIPMQTHAAYSRGWGVSVTYAGQAVDSIAFSGKTINAIYRSYTGTNGSDSTYSCAAFVSKFYSEAFGVTVTNMWKNTSTPNVSSGSFSQTRSPMVGDIVRYNSGVHWAVVKEVNGNVCTIIHQNGWYDTARTQASVGVQWLSSDAGVSYFTYSGNSGGGTPPSTAPTKPTVTSNKSSYEQGERVTFTWNACSNADWYDFNLQEVGGSGRSYYYDSSVVGNNTSLSFPSGIPSGTWRAQVVACNARNGLQTTPSDYTYFTCAAPAPTTYTVTYCANGGYGAPGNQTKTKDVTLYLSSIKPSSPVGNHQFLGWSTSSTATVPMYYAGGAYTANANVTLYAVWGLTYSISYNANGGTGAPSTQTKSHGSAINISSTVPTKAGTVFGWWYDSSNTRYYPGDLYTKDQSLTLTAYWIGVGSFVDDGIYEYWVREDGVKLYTVRSSATNIVLPETLGGRPVTILNDAALGSCVNARSVTIPKGVTSIQDLRRELHNIKAPELPLPIGAYPPSTWGMFTSNALLDNIYVDSQNAAFTSIGGVLFSKDGTQLVRYPIGKTATAYSIPAGTNSINSMAFIHCKNLVSVTIPNGVTTIREYAFGGCTNLANISFPNSLLSVGSAAFSTYSDGYSGTLLGTAWHENQPNGVLYAGKVAYGYKGTPPEGVDIVFRDGTLAISGGRSFMAIYNKNIDIWLPASVISIGTLCLPILITELANFTIYGYSNTYAESFATQNLVPFIAIDPHTITYDANGGIGAPASQTKIFDSPLILSNVVPTRNGYVFLGWAESPTAVLPAIFPGEQLILDPVRDLSLYAVWREDKVLIYDANGGEDISLVESISSGEIAVSSIIPTRIGYRFLGWSKNKTTATPDITAGQTIDVPSGGERIFTLYAIWQANAYTIRYNANGGTGTMATSSHTYDVPKTLTDNAFGKNGFSFIGWTSIVGEEAVFADRASVVSLIETDGAVVDLYAVWMENEVTPANYILTLNANGGSVTPPTVAQEPGTTYALPTPTRSGYTFTSWTLSGGGSLSGNTYTFGTSNGTVTAQWTAKTTNYNVTVNSGSGGGSYAMNATVTITANAAPSGKVFDKWTTSDGVSFSNASSTTTTFTMPAKNVSVTATYKDATKKIFSTKYDSNFLNWILFFLCFGFIWMWF